MHSSNPHRISRGSLAAAFVLLAGTSVQAGTLYLARLSQANENPPTGAPFTGTGVLILNDAENQATVTATHNINIPVTGGHIHRGTTTVNGPVIFPFAAPTSPVGPLTWTIPAADVDNLKNQGLYMNFHTAINPGGAIRDTLRRALLGPAAMTPVQQRLANALDLSAGYNTDLDSILVATNLADTATQNWTLDQLRGGTIHALGRQGVETMMNFETTVFAYTDDVRAQPALAGNRLNGFIRAGNEFGDRSASPNQLGSSISRWFTLLGADMQLGPSTRAGLALGFADGKDDFDNGYGDTKVKTTALQGYLSFGFGDSGLFLDATGGYGATSGDTTRNLTSLMRTATASPDGNVWSGALRLSKAFGGAGKVAFVPYAFVDVQKASVDDYSETGATAADLVVEGHELWSSAFEAGTSVVIPLQAGGGGMSFRLQAGWHYLMEDGAGSTSTWLEGSPLGFTTEFDGQQKSTARVAATFEAAVGNGMLITLGYRGLLGGDAQHAVEAGLAFRF
jgi:hypothetical protein